MEKKKYMSAIIRSTESGRLYIESTDFFNQDRVKKMVKELVNSNLYKRIKERKLEKV